VVCGGLVADLWTARPYRVALWTATGPGSACSLLAHRVSWARSTDDQVTW